MIGKFATGRVVERDSKSKRKVTLTFLAGPFVGNPQVYIFPSISLAEKFAEEVDKKDESGVPVSVPEKYRKYTIPH